MVTLTELSMPEVRIREQRHVRVGLKHVGQIGLSDFPGDIDMIRVRGRRGRGFGKRAKENRVPDRISKLGYAIIWEEKSACRSAWFSIPPQRPK